MLAAVIRDPRPTVRSVMEAAGLHSTNGPHAHLRWLRDASLVDWLPGHAGTLHATVRAIPVGRHAPLSGCPDPVVCAERGPCPFCTARRGINATPITLDRT